jgi:hypothetical protein|tara:strand:+ start:7786 stop:8118 length:333 start_codon:yes stop_codon:yes gene_type:complete
MPELRIIWLKCVKKDDTFGKDSVHIRIDGDVRWGPEDFSKGEQREIGTTHHFDSNVIVDIEELDSLSATDMIGTLRLTKSSPKGERTQRFNQFDSDYRMRFELLEWSKAD